ncbi:alpha/beta hydrolase family protein [Trujillonella humicola]|uniref:alpha/beta hydrolase family protein n=1 Tax=Trujillonella humicola TaxID=3383699 RepID=UPI003906302D
MSPAPRRRHGARAAAAVACALLLGGCTAGAAAQQPVPGATASGPAAPATDVRPVLTPGVHRLPVGGQESVVLVPEEPNGRLVVYAHGYGADLRDIPDDEAFGGLAQGLVDAGYAVAASSAGGNAWGDAASVDAHAVLAATARRLTGARDVYLVAESMGGLAGAQLVTGDRIEGLRAYAGLQPLCDLSSIYSWFPGSIDAVYGADAGAAVAALSPVRLDADVPVRLWASDADTVVTRDRNADVCAAQVLAAGGDARVVPVTGDHGHPSHYDLPGLLAFFDAATP